MIHTDFHLHTCFSADSTAPVSAMIKKAIEIGFSTICFTDHLDYDYPVFEDGIDFSYIDIPTYLLTMSQMKELYADKIEILCGIELGLMDYLAPRYQEFLEKYTFDFIIGSSHLVDGMDPYYPMYFEKYTEKEGIEKYFDSILQNINAFTDFDVYGHLDYIVRYAPNGKAAFQYELYKDQIDAVLKRLIELGKGIELNTAGLKYGLGYAHPHMSILKRYRELGGEIITVGSDAHKPEHMAFDFMKVPSILKEAGFEYYTIFKQRTPIFIRL